MKPIIILSILLIAFPSWLWNIKSDKLKIFASLPYYGSDFDGDGIGDLSVWNERTNTLYFQLSNDNKFYEKKFFDDGISYEPAFADFDGDKKTDFVFFQPDSGQWIVSTTVSANEKKKLFFGNKGDIPIPSDLNGDGIFDFTVWRPNAGAWFLTAFNEEAQKFPTIIYEGSYQDSAFLSDYDGDKKSDLGVWRPDDGYWHIVKSSTHFDFNQSEHIQHGKEWDVIVPNDYDGDGRCDLVLWRPSNKTWYFRYSGDARQEEIKFGDDNDIPASLDTDGDGIPELIMWNPNKKTWNILNLAKKESYAYTWRVPNGCVPSVSILQKYQ